MQGMQSTQLWPMDGYGQHGYEEEKPNAISASASLSDVEPPAAIRESGRHVFPDVPFITASI